MKFFIVIDMQKDFLDGALANPDAVAIVPNIKAKIAEYREKGYTIVFTRDTHHENYLETGEGKHLKVPHCIEGTPGWQITDDLTPGDDDVIIDKEHFGYDNWTDYIEPGDEVVMCGTCTDICVVSNALAIKMIENVEVTVLADCCAGLSKETHDLALTVMKTCQCNIE